MATTLQQLVDQARKPLNDVNKVRWPDATLLQYAIGALTRIRLLRPDLYFGTYAAPTDLQALTVGSTFPIDTDYLEAVADYVRARAQTHDTEPVESEEAPIFFALFKEVVG